MCLLKCVLYCEQIFSYFDPDYLTSGLTITGLVRVTSRDSAVGIATSYWMNDREVGVRVQVGSRIFSSPRRRDRLWGPPNLL
jgi:hypothetical protein